MSAKKKEGSAEKLLKQFGQKIDELIGKGKDSTSEFRDDIEDRAQGLKKTRDKVELEIQKLRDDNKEAFEEIRDGLDRAGSGVRKTFESLLRKKKKTTSKAKPKKTSAAKKKTGK